MKKIISGKRYNTDTATLVHSWWNGRDSSDFSHRSKDLYRTAKGTWFIHHSGGASSDMAKSVIGGRAGSEDIEPVSEADARRFLETHGGADALETWFAAEIEDA